MATAARLKKVAPKLNRGKKYEPSPSAKVAATPKPKPAINSGKKIG